VGPVARGAVGPLARLAGLVDEIVAGAWRRGGGRRGGWRRGGWRCGGWRGGGGRCGGWRRGGWRCGGWRRGGWRRGGWRRGGRRRGGRRRGAAAVGAAAAGAQGAVGPVALLACLVHLPVAAHGTGEMRCPVAADAGAGGARCGELHEGVGGLSRAVVGDVRGVAGVAVRDEELRVIEGRALEAHAI